MLCLHILPSVRDVTEYLIMWALVPRPMGQRHRRATEDTVTNEAFEDLDPTLVDPTAPIPSVSWRCFLLSFCIPSSIHFNYNLLTFIIIEHI